MPFRPYALALFLAACSSAPTQDTAPEFIDTGAATLSSTTSSASTTFPTDTGFSGGGDQQPDHWLHITETGFLDLTPAGGPHTDFTGTYTLQEIIDDLDTEEGPDCLVTWSWVGTEAIVAPCPSCDVAFDVVHTLLAGDFTTCRSPDQPPENLAWRLGWESSTGTMHRDVGHTGVWVPWFTGVQMGDRIDVGFTASWPIFYEEETM
jgi:hypothetical protein